MPRVDFDPAKRERRLSPLQWAALGGAGALAVGALAGCGFSGNANTGNTAPSAASGPATPGAETSSAAIQVPSTPAASSANTAPASGKTYTEIADHNPALQLWSDNDGTPADGSVPIGTKVNVICLAPNDSGMASANPGFYKFKYDGQTVYGIADEFANGDPAGVSGYNTTYDKAVPDCPPAQ